MKNSTLEKLIAHEKSARAIGSTAEADNYARRIAEIKKTMPPVPKSPAVSKRLIGIWKCSCGADISLDVDATRTGERLINLMLSPHKIFGHRLTKIS